MDKPEDGKKSERRITAAIMVVMTLWGGIGLIGWVISGMPFGFSSAYAAGHSFGTMLLFAMLGFGAHGLYKRRQAKKATHD